MFKKQNADTDLAIIKGYSEHEPLDAVFILAKQLELSPNTIKKRAQKLRILKSFKSKPTPRWTIPEIKLVSQNPQLSNIELCQLLLEKGHQRTTDGIDSYRRRHFGWSGKVELDEFVSGYSTIEIAKLLNVETSTVQRWIKKGLLQSHTNGHPYPKVKRIWLFDFLMEYPARWQGADVDSVWLVDLIHEFTTKNKAYERVDSTTKK